MNLSEQIQEKLKTLSELERLIPSLLDEGDQQLVQEVLELLNALAEKTDRVLKMFEIGSDLLQEARSFREGDLSSRGNKLDDEALQDKFVSSSPQDELHRDTSVAGISSQASTEVFYIRYQDHKSTEGCYVSKPDDGDTRFQITVSQSNPHVGILQFRDGLDEITKAEIMGSRSYPLIRKESSWGGEGRSQGTHEDGEVGLDPELKRWRLITPIKIK